MQHLQLVRGRVSELKKRRWTHGGVTTEQLVNTLLASRDGSCDNITMAIRTIRVR